MSALVGEKEILNSHARGPLPLSLSLLQAHRRRKHERRQACNGYSYREGSYGIGTSSVVRYKYSYSQILLFITEHFI
jgi:hypothetical protein